MAIGPESEGPKGLASADILDAHLWRLVEDLHVGVLVQGPRAEVLYANPRAADLMGIPIGILVGRTSLEATGLAVREDGTPFPGSDHPGPRVLATGRSVRDLVMGWKRPDSRDRVWLLVSATPLARSDGQVSRVLCTFTDITAQRVAEQEVRTSEERYRLLVERAQDIIYRTDRTGFFTYVNPVAGRVMGWPVEELIGKHFLELIREDHRSRVEERLKAQYRGRTAVSYDEFVVVTRTGQEIWIGQYVQFLGDPEPRGFQAVARDITARRQAEAALERARQAAMAEATLKSDLVISMTERLREPLHRASGAARLLSDTRLDTTQKDLLDEVRRATRELMAVSEDVSELSRLESGRMAFERADVAPRSIVEMAVQQGREAARGKSLEVTAEVDEDVPAILRGDASRVRRALDALVSNAVRYTRAGAVTVRASVALISDGEVSVRFEVADTGPGLPKDAEDRLVDPRAHPGTGAPARRGLGLVLCKSLVEGMRGELRWRSAPGRGSTFSIVLPLARAAAPAPPRPPANLGRVLVVEDNPINQKVARAMLQSLGYEVEMAVNGLEAVQACDVTRYDAILMDCHMPELDGFKATAFIRQREAGARRTPIIAVTAAIHAEDRAHCLAAGMDDYLSKPVMLETLAATLRRWIAPAPQTGEGDGGLAIGDPLRTAEAEVGSRVFAEVIGLFLDTMPRTFGEMRAAVAQDDAAGLRALAQGVKGASAQIGARGMADLCAQILARAGQRDFVGAASLVAELEADFASIRAGLAGRRRD